MNLEDPETKELFALFIPDDVYEKYKRKYQEREDKRNAKKILIESLIREMIEETEKIKRREQEELENAKRNAALFMNVENLGAFTGKL